MVKNTESPETEKSELSRWRISLPHLDWRSKTKWFIGEFFVVVSGILAALALDAWWTAEQRHKAEAAYINSLQVELETNKTLIESHLERLAQQQESLLAHMINVVHAEPDTISQDSLREMWKKFGPPLTIPPQTSSFNDLVSGGLQLIRNADFRRLVLRYGQALELDAIRQERAEIYFDGRVQTYDETHADLAGMWYLSEGEKLGYPDLRFEFDTAAFVGNRQFANLYMARYYRIRNVVKARKAILEVLNELLTQIETMNLDNI